ncbi:MULTISPECIES: AAA family ATPase [Bacteria]|uniref:nucleotide-binding protein n=1 Tax=Bacteria TaxID=2 RepID=UPI003C798465
MTPERRTKGPEDDDEFGVLDDSGAVDTTTIGVLGIPTAQVSVTLPAPSDEELADDDVVDDEPFARVFDEDPAALVPEPDAVGRIHRGSDIADIVIEVPASADPGPSAQASAPKEAEDEPVAVAPAPAFEGEPEPEGEGHGGVRVAAPEPAASPTAVSGNGGEGRAEPARPDVSRTEETVAASLSGPPVLGIPARVISASAFGAPAATSSPASEDRSTPLSATAALEAESPEHLDATAASAPSSRRVGEVLDQVRESADLLTADRLLDPHRIAKAEPEGAWSHFLYRLSGGRINIGDGRKVRERKALSARIAAPLAGTARFVPVLSRKGGVGKTTVTTLLGMALADARDDRVIAVDANPDRGTLADRVARSSTKTVRDLVRAHDRIEGFHDISALVSRDETRLDVLASDSDPHVSEAFGDSDYEQVADIASRYYSLVLTDTGTGVVHAVMGPALDRADVLVVVAGLSVEAARLASETLTWLETNGYADRVRDAVVVLNQTAPGAPMVRLDELEAHFTTRVRRVVRLPYDPAIASGSAISYAGLRSETRAAARELAAVVVEGLREADR